MSLTRLALRMATVMALRGNTYAGTRVFDSRADAVQPEDFETAQPVIIVFTDADDMALEGNNWLDAERRIDLVIEVFMGSRLVHEDGQPDEVEIPQTDSGLELALDLVGRQIVKVLQGGVQGTWPELWREIVCRINKVSALRGAGTEKGVKYAAKQYIITVETIAEPPFNLQLEDTTWGSFVAALGADAATAPLAEVIRDHIACTFPSEWVAQAAEIGVNPHAVQSMGLGPAFLSETNGDPVPLDEVVPLVEAGQLGADGPTYNETSLEENLPPEE